MITSWPCTARSRMRPWCSPRSELPSAGPCPPPVLSELLSLQGHTYPGLPIWRWWRCSPGGTPGQMERDGSRVSETSGSWVGSPCTDGNSEAWGETGMAQVACSHCFFTEGLCEISGINPMQNPLPTLGGNSAFSARAGGGGQLQDVSTLPHFTDGKVEPQWLCDLKPLPPRCPFLCD